MADSNESQWEDANALANMFESTMPRYLDITPKNACVGNTRRGGNKTHLFHICYGCEASFAPKVFKKHQLASPGCCRRIESCGQPDSLVNRPTYALVGSVDHEVRMKILRFQSRVKAAEPELGKDGLNTFI